MWAPVVLELQKTAMRNADRGSCIGGSALVIPGRGLFDKSDYQQANLRMGSLQESLPQAAVTALAREVVLRLAEKSKKIPQVDVDPHEGDVEALSRALISDDPDAGADLIVALQQRGVRVETIYLSYLAMAARRLGEWWDTDQATFAQVTAGAGRIYAIMRGLRPLMAPSDASIEKSVVFALVPGETHTLGISMATDLFRERGWEVDLLLGLDHDDLVTALGKSGSRLIGLSAGGQRSILPLMKLIVALRVSNPEALIMVSGQVAALDVDIVGQLGADAAASSFDQAVSLLSRLARIELPYIDAR